MLSEPRIAKTQAVEAHPRRESHRDLRVIVLGEFEAAVRSA